MLTPKWPQARSSLKGSSTPGTKCTVNIFRAPLKEEVLDFIDSGCPRVPIFIETASSHEREILAFMRSRITFSLAWKSSLRAQETC